jgi:hypothetical protein
MTTAEICAAWLEMEDRLGALTDRWQALETWLFDHAPDFDLDDPLACGRPEAAEMVALDQRIAALLQERNHLLDQLPALVADDLAGVLAKLEVAVRLLLRTDHPQAHALVAGARRELQALAGAQRPPPPNP